MSNFNPKICREDIDFARGFAFLLETRRKADPGPTRNMYQLMLRSATYGGMILYEDKRGRIVAIACYSLGTEREAFEDRHVVHVDYVLMKPELQGSYYFLKCMDFFSDTISTHHPEVKNVTMEAEATSKRNNRLYSKFAQLTEVVQGDLDVLHVYQTTVDKFSTYAKNLLSRIRRDEAE